MNKCLYKKIAQPIFCILFILLFCKTDFCMWAQLPDNAGLIWIADDGVSFLRDGWHIIDDDKDGVGYYYYFDEGGKLLIDTITPDLSIVNILGQKIDINGNPISVELGTKIEENSGMQSAILENLQVTKNSVGSTSGGSINTVRAEVGPVIAPATNQNGYIISPNTNIHKTTDEYKYDATLSRDPKKYITSSKSFAKSVNGTIFTKAKWNGVMALKGDGANIVFSNPQNNFNRLRGRVATHYFTYTDRTTICTLIISDADTEEELYSTSAFNYNGGVSFDIVFSRYVNNIRLELNVSGQYTTRVMFIRELRFGFDKEAFNEEKEELEMQKEIESAYLEGANISTVSEAEVDEDAEETTANETSNDNFAGPHFDSRLTKASESQIVGPDGSIIRRMIPGK